MEINILTIAFLIAGIIFGLVFGVIIGKVIKYKTIKDERKKSIKKSKSVIMGELYEKILPFLPDFKYKPRDMVFVGKGVDYIIFDGLDEGDLKQIVFLELKSGNSNLNKNERMIRNIIRENKIKYIEYKIKK
ncbi:MAG: Holliday junction resolvase [Candidatus Gracilibacteria bacterium]|nr:Holliday junction resolvase [Candidatus Gracilibacteria bacterium]